MRADSTERSMHGLCFISIANELCTARSISLLGQLETAAPAFNSDYSAFYS
jgi:hypothetical protein